MNLPKIENKTNHWNDVELTFSFWPYPEISTKMRINNYWITRWHFFSELVVRLLTKQNPTFGVRHYFKDTKGICRERSSRTTALMSEIHKKPTIKHYKINKGQDLTACRWDRSVDISWLRAEGWNCRLSDFVVRFERHSMITHVKCAAYIQQI